MTTIRRVCNWEWMTSFLTSLSLSPFHTLHPHEIINYLSVCFSDCIVWAVAAHTHSRYTLPRERAKRESRDYSIGLRAATSFLFVNMTFLNRISLSSTISRMFIFRVCFLFDRFQQASLSSSVFEHVGMWDVCFIHIIRCALSPLRTTSSLSPLSSQTNVTIPIRARIYCVTQSRFVACVSVWKSSSAE